MIMLMSGLDRDGGVPGMRNHDYSGEFIGTRALPGSCPGIFFFF